MHLVDGIRLYNSGSHNLSDPFMTIFSSVGILMANRSFGGVAGVPISNIFCWVTFGMKGETKFECFGVTAAWFDSIAAPGNFPAWKMKAVGGIEHTLMGECPFIPPFGLCSDRDPDDNPNAPCWRGLSVTAPLFVVSSQFAYFGDSGTAFGLPQAEFQSCDLSEENTRLDPGNGPASPWNTLSRNCCANTEDQNDTGVGDGDTDVPPPPPGDTCGTNGLFCKYLCKFDRGGGQRIWCLPTENGRLTNYCVTETAGNCKCSSLDLAGNPIPDPNTVPLGTIIFVKCTSGIGQTNLFDCNFIF
jgi:hypothetical protein